MFANTIGMDRRTRAPTIEPSVNEGESAPRDFIAWALDMRTPKLSDEVLPQSVESEPGRPRPRATRAPEVAPNRPKFGLASMQHRMALDCKTSSSNRAHFTDPRPETSS